MGLCIYGDIPAKQLEVSFECAIASAVRYIIPWTIPQCMLLSDSSINECCNKDIILGPEKTLNELFHSVYVIFFNLKGKVQRRHIICRLSQTETVSFKTTKDLTSLIDDEAFLVQYGTLLLS
jgi:hypothetical protein